MRKAPAKGSHKGKSELRIIGGQWRGRRLTFVAEEGLRPTLDRYRETLFNWLMFEVEGARCLDLFAGSGALGLEALSRGARHVDFVDISAQATANIKHHLHTLQCERASVYQSGAEPWLKQQRAAKAYDLIFLDPPFHKDLLQPCLYLLEYGQFFHAESKIYLEAEESFQTSKLPPHWHIIKEKKTKNKLFLLLECPTPQSIQANSVT